MVVTHSLAFGNLWRNATRYMLVQPPSGPKQDQAATTTAIAVQVGAPSSKEEEDALAVRQRAAGDGHEVLPVRVHGCNTAVFPP